MESPTQLGLSFGGNMARTVDIIFPHVFGSNKITVIKALRTFSYLGLKDAKDMSETPNVVHHVPVLMPEHMTTELEEQFRIMRVEGCKVGSPVHEILANLRTLATEALNHNEDELANEILQLILVEKLRRGPGN